MEIDGRVCVDITTRTGTAITVYVSAQGRSVRVYKDGQEMRVT